MSGQAWVLSQQESIMSQNGSGQSHLRIGGWLSQTGQSDPDHGQPLPDSAVPAAQHPTAPDDPKPTAEPLAAADPGAAVGRYRVTGGAVGQRRARGTASRAAADRRAQLVGRAAPRRTHLLGGVGLVVVTALIGVIALRDASPQEPIRGEFVAGMPSPADPALGDRPTDVTRPETRAAESAPPSPIADTVARPGLNPRAAGGDASPDPTTVPDTVPAMPGSHAPPAAPNSPVPPPAAPADPGGPALVPGARIGLEFANLPGHRVRHVNFQARAERVGPASGPGVKADAAFVVRTGLADSGCVSFESVNFPGYHLRHVEFRVFLHRSDGSALFRADSTFCPVTGIGGRHVSLRAYNYPDRYLSHDSHRQMRISPIGNGASPATATFLIRPAL
ncbi:hypothetical protein FF096_08190 [Micromonospora sp. CP22]|nr:hypothetical protein [Micromonospora sp. CP22]